MKMMDLYIDVHQPENQEILTGSVGVVGRLVMGLTKADITHYYSIIDVLNPP